jgi:hypothetical protein
MIVLFIDAFGESADSNARFVQLKGILNSVLQATGSARQGVQLDIRKFNQCLLQLRENAVQRTPPRAHFSGLTMPPRLYKIGTLE